MKFALLFACLLLAACGGGGGDTPDTDTSTLPPANDTATDSDPAPPANDDNSSSNDAPPPLSPADQALLAELWFPTALPTTNESTLRPEAVTRFYNPEAVIPPQCYTRHEAQYNPCMTCHQSYDFGSRPNSMSDGNLQSAYLFSDQGNRNHWRNLFEDRRDAMAGISDQDVIDYIYTDNYSTLIEQLKNTADWRGPIPEIANLEQGANAFDGEGFAKDGSHWVAFNYKPLPSTFWPTNGSTDDVMIRLPEKFRTSNCQPGYSRDSYLANLSILEAAIKDLPRIDVPAIDESRFCTDLNGDGRLGIISEIIRPTHFVGAAADVAVTPMLYPEGTEFLHTVRYVGISPKGWIEVPARMKEVRYMNKYAFHDVPSLASMYGNERQEKIDGQLPQYIHRGDKGTDNSFGWLLLGFIEDGDGRLRQQNEEETFFCMGCHTTIGSTIDQTFAFARKVTGAKGWSYINLRGMADAPYVGGTGGEIAHYLATVGGGNEFRENEEILQRFFNADHQLNHSALEGLDVYALTTPSLRRALDLNKAYMTIVQDQDFIHGRDANLRPAENVYQEIDPNTAPVLPADKTVRWDMRLDWD